MVRGPLIRHLGRSRREAVDITELDDFIDNDSIFALTPFAAPLIGTKRGVCALRDRLEAEFADATRPSARRAATVHTAYALMVVWVGSLLGMIGPDIALSPAGAVAGASGLIAGIVRPLGD